MSLGLPFAPLQASSTAGLGTTLTANGTTSVPGTIALTSALQANNILISNLGTVGGWARVSTEATPVATNADIPVPGGASIVVGCPKNNGTVGVAWVGSGAMTTSVSFCPGEGGR